MGTVDMTPTEIVNLFEQFTKPNYLNTTAVRFDEEAVDTVLRAAAPTLHCKDMVWVMGKSVGGALVLRSRPGKRGPLKDLFDYDRNKQPLGIGYLMGSEVWVDKGLNLVPRDALIFAAMENKKIIKYRALWIDVLAN